jgi:hypothetical protein
MSVMKQHIKKLMFKLDDVTPLVFLSLHLIRNAANDITLFPKFFSYQGGLSEIRNMSDQAKLP